MFKDNNAAALVPALVLTMLVGCGKEPSNTGEKVTQQVSSKCALDGINGVNAPVVQSKAGKADFGGWAVDSNTNTTPAVLNVVLTDAKGVAFVFAGAQRNERPDVVKAFKQDAFLNSGFRLSADVSTLAAGSYSISLQMPVNNSVVICHSKKMLLVN